MANRILTYSLLFILSFSLKAQDIQFSQYYNAPIVQSSAKTGEKSEATRFAANYRSQWASISQPYSSANFSIDKYLGQFGGGLMVNHHGGGPGSVEHTNLLASVSYLTKMNESNALSFGVQGGFFQTRVNQTGLSFDQQYNTDIGYNPNAASGENFDQLRTSSPDFNWGIIWYNGEGVNSRINTSLGLGMLHTFEPNASLLNDYQPLDRTYVLHGSLDYKINDRLKAEPNFRVMRSNNFMNTIVTAIGSYEVKSHEIISLGIGNRFNDAVIFYGGIQFTNDLSVGLSYDMHYSNLAPSTFGLASFEISIIYLFNKNKKVVLENVVMAEKTDEVDLLKIDTDRDGIPDYMDECPKVYGSPEKNGCPFALHDIDGDGISDKMDKCPQDWGPLKNSGCPVKKQKKQDIEEQLQDDRRHVNEVQYIEDVDLVGPIKINNIEFATNSASIDQKYYERLDRLYQVLKNNPKYEVLLSGHTDHEGSASYNLMLGENRANVIKDHLVRKGIKRNRISIVSYGENKPLGLRESNNPTDMAKNRRTEIIVIKN